NKPKKIDSETEAAEDEKWCEQQATFWFEFGYLVSGIMSRPMKMEAIKRTTGLNTLTMSGEEISIDLPEPTANQVYKFAAFCYKRSISLRQDNWRSYFMLAKTLEKIGSNSEQVIYI